MYVSEHIQAGTCFVNCYNKTDVASPFGGFKQSGFGKDLGECCDTIVKFDITSHNYLTGEDALHEYLHTKVVTVEY